MFINSANISAMFTGFNTSYRLGFEGAATYYAKIAMKVPSQSREENYSWMNQQSGMREWVGPRVVKNLSSSNFSIKNRKFEDTIGVPREDIEDDKYGLLGPYVAEMGRRAAEQPDILCAELLTSGFTAKCYDGQPYFDADHPVGDGANGPTVSVSNLQTGSGKPWFLFDTGRAVKPIIYQERVPATLTPLVKDSDENVFMQDEYLYGVRARSNVGFGLWQLAYASKADLTPANYEAARAAMMAFKGDGGRPLGIIPNVLVASPGLEGPAMRLLNNGTRIEVVSGVPVPIQNEWAKTAELIVTPWLA